MKISWTDFEKIQIEYFNIIAYNFKTESFYGLQFGTKNFITKTKSDWGPPAHA